MTRTRKASKLLKSCMVFNEAVSLNTDTGISVNFMSIDKHRVIDLSIHNVPTEAFKEIAKISGLKIEVLESGVRYIKWSKDSTLFEVVE